MAFWDDAKNKVMQAIRPRQQEDNQVISNRADGGFSGYVPKMNRPQQDVQATGYQQARPAGMENMMPTGVDPSVMQGFQPVGGQTGQMPPQGAQPQQGMPRPQAQFQGQPMQQPAGGPQPMGAAQPMGQPMQQGPRPGFGQPAFQQNAPQQGYTGKFQQPPAGGPMGAAQPMQQGFTGKQPFPPQMPPQGAMPQQPQPAKNDGHTFVFPGESYMVDGNAYKLVFRVAQITGVPSCFRVIEFMYNNEAVIVNAEQITDLVEADRCMDLIFGAACAMKQRLMRVSGKQIYLITPPQVYVAPFEPLRRAGMADIERRWPGALQANMQPQQSSVQPFVNNVQPMNRPQMPQMQPMPQGMPYQQPMAANQAMYNNPMMQTNQAMHTNQATPVNPGTTQQRPFAQPRQDDFAGGFGRRAARNAMHTNGYTDYGGFGMKTR